MLRTTFVVTVSSFAALVLAATPAEAQGRGQQNRAQGIPPGHLPPAGQCRVWYEGVPPGRQPAPESCGSAERRAASARGARVIYGGNTNDRRNDERWERGGGWESDGSWGRNDRWEDRYPDARYPESRYPDSRSRTSDQGRSRIGGNVADRRAYPSRLPEMVRVSQIQQGRRTADQQRWLGQQTVRVRYLDQDRNGRPEQIIWYDSRGNILQRWIDDTRNGRANRVIIYQNGRVVQQIT